MKTTVMPKNLKELMELIEKATNEGAKVEFVNAETGEKGAESLLKALKAARGRGTLEMESLGEGGDPAGDAIDAFLREHGHTGKDGCPGCGEDHGSDAAKPTAELANKLLSIAATHQSPPKYKPGEFVRYKDHIQYVRNGRGLHCVVENLDPPRQMPLDDTSEGSPTVYRNYDILIATQSRTGICVYLADSREMEPFPDADKLMGKNS